MRPGREGLGDVAGIADAAVGDDRHAAAGDALGRLVDRRDLRHADAGDDPRRADRPRPDAHLDRVRPRLHQRPRPFRRGDVAGDHVDVEAPLDLRDRLDARCCEWPWAESTTSTSTPAWISDSARS